MDESKIKELLDVKFSSVEELENKIDLWLIRNCL